MVVYHHVHVRCFNVEQEVLWLFKNFVTGFIMTHIFWSYGIIIWQMSSRDIIVQLDAGTRESVGLL